MKTLFEQGHALLIGVGDDLPLTVNDATAIQNVLADPNLAGYPPENISLLVNEDADRKGILKALDDLVEKADENATVFIFYSGHGGVYEPWDQYYLVPNGFDPENFEETWLKAEELQDRLKALKSKKTILFLDCCHAQGMTKTQSKSAPMVKEPTPKSGLTKIDELAKKMDDVSGLSYVSSCRENELSWIIGENNSLFTEVLLEVLRGEHKKEFKDSYIRMTEVLQHLWQEVPKRAPEPQRPTVKIEMDDDLILTLVPKAQRKSAPIVVVEKDDFLIEIAKEEIEGLKENFKTQTDLIKQLRTTKLTFIDASSVFKTELQILQAEEERSELMIKIKELMKQIA